MWKYKPVVNLLNYNYLFASPAKIKYKYKKNSSKRDKKYNLKRDF